MIRNNTPETEIQYQLRQLPKETVIGEFAGRDSMAALSETGTMIPWKP